MSTVGLALARPWHAYLTLLRAHPVRTKMATAAGMFVVGDSIAQLGIEDKELPLPGKKGDWDPVRTARLGFYGGVLFAPLTHLWLEGMARIKLQTAVRTLAARLTLDSFVWSPFVCHWFPTCMGALEGKSIPEIKQKVDRMWFPTWIRAQFVFGPTQIINYSIIPAEHRLLVLQSVGMCWNIYISWSNNRHNVAIASSQLGVGPVPGAPGDANDDEICESPQPEHMYACADRVESKSRG